MPENIQAKSGPGGRRPGAGRKKGSATRKTREIADKAAEQGITPLEVMLAAMREAYEQATKPDVKADVRLAYLEKAASVAKDAAPYIHPRLASIEHGNKDGGAFIVKLLPADDDL